jgi:hypothetical protein
MKGKSNHPVQLVLPSMKKVSDNTARDVIHIVQCIVHVNLKMRMMWMQLSSFRVKIESPEIFGKFLVPSFRELVAGIN